MITLEQYWMGRDVTHATAMTPQIERNAFDTVERANKLLILARGFGIDTQVDQRTKSNCSGGWRPPAVNRITPGAALNSKHLDARAIDLYDPDGDLDEWLLANPKILKDLGLWLEHPSATKGWSHVQTVAPKSGNRVFYP